MAGMLDNYVPVSERLAAAAADGLAAITTQEPVMLGEQMGYIRAVVEMQDGRRASGTATFQLGLSGKSAQATNPIEDAETSAVGRALAFLGYEVKRGVASREEVREAQRRSEQPKPAPKAAPSGDVSGVVEQADFRYNDKGQGVLKMVVSGETYMLYGAHEDYSQMQPGDEVMIRPGKPMNRGGFFVDEITAWSEAPAVAA